MHSKVFSWLRRQPLVHFLLIGAVILAFWQAATGGGDTAPTEIRVGAAELRWLHETWRAQFGRPPNATEMQAAVRGYVDEEMRYREGLALGLDRDDSIVRRRLAQKYDFMLGEQAAALVPTEAELRATYARAPDRYLPPVRVSICQVYFGEAAAGLAAAKAALARLSPAEVRAADAVSSTASALPYPRCYDNVTSEAVTRDFGDFFAGVVTNQLAPGAWQGPVQSGYGYHLVRVQSRAPGGRSDFEAARAAVEQDWLKARGETARKQQDEALRSRYSVRVDQAALERLVKASPQ